MIDATSSSFWSRFWPAVVTFVGVAVGMPVALRIQGVITGQADRKTKQEDDNLRRNVLATLARSIRSNSAALSALHDRLADPFILPLRREVLAEIGELVAISNSLEMALTDAAGLKPPELPAANASLRRRRGDAQFWHPVRPNPRLTDVVSFHPEVSAGYPALAVRRTR